MRGDLVVSMAICAVPRTGSSACGYGFGVIDRLSSVILIPSRRLSVIDVRLSGDDAQR